MKPHTNQGGHDMTAKRYFELLRNFALDAEDIKNANNTLKRVEFLDNGWASVKTIIVEALTNGEAIEAAEKMYKDNGWTFKYAEIEVCKCL